MEKLLYTRKDAAGLLSISVDKLDDLRNCGCIQCTYLGSRCYYSADELRAFVLKISKD
jgi:hypothetical protein